MTDPTRLLLLQQCTPAYWRGAIDNPPINLFDPEMTTAFAELIDRLEADDDVKVVVFDSANPEFFMAHIDIAPSSISPPVPPAWRPGQTPPSASNARRSSRSPPSAAGHAASGAS